MTQKEHRSSYLGFSLIELIIAIAILVILTGLLAPAFLRWIEKSRAAACTNNRESVVKTAITEGIDGTTVTQDTIEAILNEHLSKKILCTDTTRHIYSGICKGNGEVTITVTDESAVVTCSQHGSTASGTDGGTVNYTPDDFMQILTDSALAMVAEKYGAAQWKGIDSEGPNAGAAIKALLKSETGRDDLFSFRIYKPAGEKTWKVYICQPLSVSMENEAVTVQRYIYTPGPGNTAGTFAYDQEGNATVSVRSEKDSGGASVTYPYLSIGW